MLIRFGVVWQQYIEFNLKSHWMFDKKHERIYYETSWNSLNDNLGKLA